MDKVKKVTEMKIDHLINSIDYYFNKDSKKTMDCWYELKKRLDKLSWGNDLIKMYNEPFYKKYILTGLLEKSSNYNNGVPIYWEDDVV